MIIEILTGILTLVTAIYAYLTLRMAKASEASVEAMRVQSEAMVRPYITVFPYVRPHTTILYIKVINMGKTAALNLRLSIDHDFFQWGEANSPENNLRSFSAFSKSIDSFAPGMELLFALAQGNVVLCKDDQASICPKQFNITATYDFFEKSITEITPIDLRPYVNSEGARDPLVEELERIRRILEKAN